MKVSFGSWAFTFGPYARNPISFAEAAGRIAEAGYDGIEVSGFPPHITASLTEAHVREAKRILDDLGLGVSAYVPDFTMVNPLVETNRKRYLDTFRRALDRCRMLASPAVRVDTIGAPGSIPESESEATADRLAEVWREAAEIASGARVRMVWEFEPGFAFNKLSEIVSIYEQVGHPNFQILFDTCHAYLCGVVGARQQGTTETLPGGVDEFLDRLSGRIGHIHIVDTDGTLYGEETSTHCPLGEGLIQFDKLAPKLKAVPGIPWWCVDLSFYAGCADVLKPNLEYVRNLLR